MILVLIGAIIGLIVSIYRTYNDSWGEFLDYIVNGFLGIIFGGAICGFIAWLLPMETHYKHSSIDIVNLQDNSSINGNFFLGCGQVNGDMKYVFYTNTDGLYQLEQLDCDMVKIHYSDGKPKINITELCPTESVINWFAIDWNCFNKTYVIDVPKGSITNNFKLDAQ